MRHGLDRTFLHASSLVLTVEGQRVELVAPLAADLRAVLASMEAGATVVVERPTIARPVALSLRCASACAGRRGRRAWSRSCSARRRPRVALTKQVVLEDGALDEPAAQQARRSAPGCTRPRRRRASRPRPAHVRSVSTPCRISHWLNGWALAVALDGHPVPEAHHVGVLLQEAEVHEDGLLDQRQARRALGQQLLLLASVVLHDHGLTASQSACFEPKWWWMRLLVTPATRATVAMEVAAKPCSTNSCSAATRIGCACGHLRCVPSLRRALVCWAARPRRAHDSTWPVASSNLPCTRGRPTQRLPGPVLRLGRTFFSCLSCGRGGSSGRFSRLPSSSSRLSWTAR